MLSIALLVGPILLVDLRLLGRARALTPPAFALVRRTAAVGLAGALATGVMLFAARPHDYAAHPVVWLKLALIAIGIANAARFAWVARHGAPPSASAQVAAILSLLAWLGALAAGRAIAFVDAA